MSSPNPAMIPGSGRRSHLPPSSSQLKSLCSCSLLVLILTSNSSQGPGNYFSPASLPCIAIFHCADIKSWRGSSLLCCWEMITYSPTARDPTGRDWGDSVLCWVHVTVSASQYLHCKTSFVIKLKFIRKDCSLRSHRTNYSQSKVLLNIAFLILL